MNEAYSWLTTPLLRSDDKLVNFSSQEIEKVKKLPGQGQEQIKRYFLYEL